VIPIKKINELDKSIAALVIFGIVFTSLAWIGDLASWEEISVLPTVNDIKTFGKMDPSVEFFCQVCGEIIGEFDGMCKHCGTLRPSCVVCGGFLSFADSIVQLPCCRHFGHQKHVEEHLKKKKSCPNCEKKIGKEDLLIVKPD